MSSSMDSLDPCSSNMTSTSSTGSDSGLVYLLWHYWSEVQDPRTADFPLVNCSPYPVLAVMSVYLAFSTHFGPRLMRDRAPLQLRSLMLAYNFAMVGVNAYFVLWWAMRPASLWTRLTDFTYPDRTLHTAEVRAELTSVWWYWMSKFADLLDTVWMVLRKKHTTHVSVLHVFHHTMVPVYGYLMLVHNGTIPVFVLFALLNGTIHVAMYAYYGLCLCGPQVRPYLWWKRYLTQLQLAQFCALISYVSVLGIYQTGYPAFWLYFGLSQLAIFLGLFYQFYQKSYTKPKSSPHSSALEHSNKQHRHSSPIEHNIDSSKVKAQ